MIYFPLFLHFHIKCITEIALEKKARIKLFPSCFPLETCRCHKQIIKKIDAKQKNAIKANHKNRNMKQIVKMFISGNLLRVVMRHFGFKRLVTL